MPSIKLSIITFCLLVYCSCEPEVKSNKFKPDFQQQTNSESIKNQFVEANKQVVQKENDEMDYYAKSHQMNFVKTKAGIRYFVYEPSLKGDSLNDSSMVTLSYKVSLLTGKECYSSKTEGNKTFVVGQEDIESGVHKALTYLKRGDKALILIPSHLAHGVMGDFKKIPPQMPIVYDVEVN